MRAELRCYNVVGECIAKRDYKTDKYINPNDIAEMLVYDIRRFYNNQQYGDVNPKDIADGFSKTPYGWMYYDVTNITFPRWTRPIVLAVVWD